MTYMTTLTDWQSAILPPSHRFFLIFANPELRPPVYEEMVQDMGNIINKVVAGYVDPSCMELHFEELVAECWLKTTEMNNKGLLRRSRTRSEYFAQYKTAISNHVCSLVQKYRFTEKRTGVKPPPKGQRHVNNGEQVSSRPMEVRIDDPDANVQLSEMDSGDDSSAFRELLEEVSTRLNYLEQGVLSQLLSPNEEALFYARQEAEIGRKADSELRVRIRYEHLARGIGISVEQFRQVHETIKEKCIFMKMNREEEEPRYAAAMATLVQFFGVQIPRSIDEMTRKRALMLAAQHQFDHFKDNPGIIDALTTCNIPVPEVRNDRFKCFGIMFQKHHRTCENCGVKEACELKASNFGLGEITISHKLLGARHARVPVVRPTRRISEVAFSSEDEEEVMSFMDENFRRVEKDDGTFFRHKDKTSVGNESMIFAVDQASPLRLRFINPAEELKESLKPETGEKGGRPSWYLPIGIVNVDECINLIRAHAQITFTKA